MFLNIEKKTYLSKRLISLYCYDNFLNLLYTFCNLKKIILRIKCVTYFRHGKYARLVEVEFSDYCIMFIIPMNDWLIINSWNLYQSRIPKCFPIDFMAHLWHRISVYRSSTPVIATPSTIRAINLWKRHLSLHISFAKTNKCSLLLSFSIYYNYYFIIYYKLNILF